MTPRQVDELDSAELRAFWELLEETDRNLKRQERQARRKAR